MVKNGGLNKTSLYTPFEGLTTDSYFGKARPLGGGQIDKRLFNTLLMRKHDFWHVQWFLNGQKWDVKKPSLYDHFEGLTTDSYFGKTRPPGEIWNKKMAFFNTLLMRKHDFWPVQWFLNGQNGGLNKNIFLWPFWRFDNWLLFWQNKTPWGKVR